MILKPSKRIKELQKLRRHIDDLHLTLEEAVALMCTTFDVIRQADQTKGLQR